MSRYGTPSLPRDPNAAPLFAQPIDPIQAAFDEYHQRHPEVYELFKRLAGQLLASGMRRYSADAILHRIRWHYHIEKGDEDFKVNNNFASRYARLLMDEQPTYRDFFETRRLRA